MSSYIGFESRVFYDEREDLVVEILKIDAGGVDVLGSSFHQFLTSTRTAERCAFDYDDESCPILERSDWQTRDFTTTKRLDLDDSFDTFGKAIMLYESESKRFLHKPPYEVVVFLNHTTIIDCNKKCVFELDDTTARQVVEVLESRFNEDYIDDIVQWLVEDVSLEFLDFKIFKEMYEIIQDSLLAPKVNYSGSKTYENWGTW